MTGVMMATVLRVTSGSGLRKFQAAWRSTCTYKHVY